MIDLGRPGVNHWEDGAAAYSERYILVIAGQK